MKQGRQKIKGEKKPGNKPREMEREKENAKKKSILCLRSTRRFPWKASRCLVVNSVRAKNSGLMASSGS